MTRLQLFKQQLNQLVNQDLLVECTLAAGGYKTKDTYYLQKDKIANEVINLQKAYNSPGRNTTNIAKHL